MPMPSPRMASGDSFQTQPGAFKHPPFRDRIDHILTTGRCKSAARWKQGRDNILVNQHWKYYYLLKNGSCHS